MKHLIIIMVAVLIPMYCIAQNEQSNKSGTMPSNKGKSMREDRDIYEDIGRFLNRYPIEKYQVQVDGQQVGQAGITKLITLLRGCSWRTEDFKTCGSYAKPYATIGIKVKGVRKKLELLVSDNGIDVSDWSPGSDLILMGGGEPITVDVYGNYEQYTMYSELIPKINEIIFQTIADFKNVEVVDTLTVIVKRIDYTIGGLVESIPMSEEDNAEFLRLYNHTIHSTSYSGGDLCYEQPSGVEYNFVYGQNGLRQISDYTQGTHEFTYNIFSEADAKAMTKLENKYIALLDSLEYPDGGFTATLPNGRRIEGCYHNGKREGVWVAYDQDDTLLELTTYRNGKRNGLKITYSPLSKYHYKDDKLDGRYELYSYNGRKEQDGKYENGNEIYRRMFHGNGQLQYVYKSIDGNWKMLEAYDDQGKKRELK